MTPTTPVTDEKITASAPAEARPLKLRGCDDEDLAILSACLQDALMLVADIVYEPEARRLVLVADRFRWESATEGALPGDPGFERVTAAVTLCGVRSVQRRNFDPRAADTILSLLAIRADPGPGAAVGAQSPADGTAAAAGPSAVIRIDFSGGRSIRLEVDSVNIYLEDLAEPRPTRWRPRHTL